MREALILQGALDLAPAERDSYLDRACGDDASLRQRIEEQLQTHIAANERTDPEIDLVSGLDLPVSVRFPSESAVNTSLPGRQPRSVEFPYLEPSDDPAALGRLGPYEILEVLGRGGMGVVFRAYDANLKRFIAIKVLTPDRCQNDSAVHRFYREAQAVSSIQQENVVRILHIVADHEPPYFVMPYIEGRSLQQVLNEQGPFGVAEIVRIGREMAAGLAAAHTCGVVHRDIKPANLLLCAGDDQVVITDFGLARGLDDVTLTSPGMVAGTPLYMSPEQARGQPLDGRSDLFSLGSVLYALCTGKPPFFAESPAAVLRCVCDETPAPIRTINPQIPDWLEDIVLRLLQKDPQRRFRSAAALAELLGKYQTELEQAPSPQEVRRLACHVPQQPPPLALLARMLVVLMLILLPMMALAFFEWPTEPSLSANQPDAERRRAGWESSRGHKFDHECPADQLAWSQIPLPLRERLGGDPTNAATNEAFPGVVAILGDPVARPFGSFNAAVYLPTGAEAILGTTNGMLLRVDTRTGGLLGDPIQAHEEQVRALAFHAHPDGLRLASGGFDQMVRIWNTTNQRLVHEIHACGRVHGLAFSGDGKRLIGLVSRDRPPTASELRVWDSETGVEIHQSTVGAGLPHALAHHPARKLLAVGTMDGTIHLLAEDGLRSIHDLKGHTHTILGLAFSPDGRRLYSGGQDRTIRTWDTEKYREVSIIQAPEGVISLAPLKGGVLAAACVDGHFLLCQPDAGKGLRQLDEPGERFRFVVPSPDGQTFLLGGWNGTLSFRETATCADQHPFAGHRGPVRSMAFEPQGKLLATAGSDRVVALWDLATGELLGQLEGLVSPATCLDFSPDSKTLATVCRDRVIRLWNVETRTLIHQWKGYGKNGEIQIRFSPTGDRLATGDDLGQVQVWTDTGRLIRSWTAATTPITGLVFGPEGKNLKTTSDEGLRAWNAATGDEVSVASEARTICRGLTWDRTSDRLAGIQGKDVLIWDRTHPASARVLELPALERPTLTSSGNGRVLVGYSADDLTLWAARLTASGEKVSLLRGAFQPSSQPQALATSPLGRHVAVSRPDGLVLILRLPGCGTREKPS